MKTILRNLLLVAMVGAVMAIVCMSCSRRLESPLIAEKGRDAISPSAKYVLRVVEDKARIARYSGRFPFYSFEIRLNQADAPLEFACDTSFIGTHALLFLWDSHDRVWVYSGDVGTYYWTKDGVLSWQEKALADAPTEVPDLLRKYRPGQYSEYGVKPSQGQVTEQRAADSDARSDLR